MFPSRGTAIPYCVLLVLGVTLAGFGIDDTSAAGPASGHTPAAIPAGVSLTIPLATLDDVHRLDQRPEIAEVIRTARVYSDSPIFLAAYVTADDVQSNRADAPGLADELVIEMGGYLASHGVEPERISGKGMGVDSAIGRAVVVSFGSTPPPTELDPRILQVRGNASRNVTG